MGEMDELMCVVNDGCWKWNGLDWMRGRERDGGDVDGGWRRG